MRYVIRKRQRSAVQLYDRFTQGKPDPEASAAVCDGIFPGVKHFKNMRFHIVCNSVSVIGDSDHGIPALFFGTYADLGALFGIFQSIINKVDNDLHDKLCVHTGKDQIVAPYRHLVSDGFFLQMRNGFVDHFVHKLVGKLQLQASVIQPCNIQQIFHHADQPFGIFINIFIDLLLGCFVQAVSVMQKRVRITRNGAKRRAQIV